MGERVLLLGAGASYGARLGLGCVNDPPLPPLGQKLAAYLTRWLTANDTSRKLRPVMHGYHHWSIPATCLHYTGDRLWGRKELPQVRTALVDVAAREKPGATTVAFEALMDEWSTSGNDQRLLSATQLLLAYSMTFGIGCAFPECPDRLDDLIAKVRPTTVVTVNYDTLTEEAMGRQGLRFTYPSLPGPRAVGVDESDFVSSGTGDVVPVFKLHGSINWLPLPGGGRSADEAVAAATMRARPTRIVPSGPLVASQTWATYVPQSRSMLFFELERALAGSGSPVVAVYGSGKNLLNNPTHVAGHREACFQRLRGTSIDSVVAVGIRLVSAADDPVVNGLVELLAARADNKLYASPSADECQEAERRGFTSVRATLEQLVAK